MTTYATVIDVESRLGRDLTEVEYARAESLLDMAQGLISLVVGGRVYATDEVPAVVKAVAVSVVERGLRNPEGLQQESAGPFSRNRMVGYGGLYLTAEEKALLLSVINRANVVSLRTPVTGAYLEAVSVFGDGYSTTDESDEGDGAS